MRADELRLAELVDFREGALNLHGRRLLLHSLHALAQFRRDLIETLGPVAARRLLTRLGYFWGHADAAAMTRIFAWENTEEWLRAGLRMLALQGAARPVLQALHFDEAPTGSFLMEVAWHDSGEAEQHLIELGRAAEPACWMVAGYASGYASFCLNRDIYFIEQSCVACGHLSCAATGKDRGSWGGELDSHLPFFQAEDIQQKVRQLTDELRRKTRELARQRRRLDRLEREAHPPLVEVRSEAFRRVVDLVLRIAPYDSSVLITGESGVGKEVLARTLHRHSPRAEKTFVAVNCGALPETLLESELFGHKAGAFTGAVRDRAGLFEEAEHGTLFLDEIGDISPATQVKLLRVLQEKEIRRVGESRQRKIDVRVLSATNRNLKQAVADGSFREDLYYRLGVIEIEVPPLRRRREDILPLARFFVQQLVRRLGLPELRLHASCLDALQSYSWPGNVRELENALERAAVLCQDQVIHREDLPPAILEELAGGGRIAPPPDATLGQIGAHHIRAVLTQTGGHRARAARILGISPSTLWRKLKAMEEPPQARAE